MFVRCEAFLYDCAAFNDIRRNQVSLSTMEELFDSVDMRQVIDFMKDINFYNCLRLRSCSLVLGPLGFLSAALR